MHKTSFFKCNDRRLALNQFFYFGKHYINLFYRLRGFWVVKMKFASPGNKINLVLLLLAVLSVQLGKSLMWRKKSMEPCGTPCDFTFQIPTKLVYFFSLNHI